LDDEQHQKRIETIQQRQEKLLQQVFVDDAHARRLGKPVGRSKVETPEAER
jgi:hypothetical protein